MLFAGVSCQPDLIPLFKIFIAKHNFNGLWLWKTVICNLQQDSTDNAYLMDELVQQFRTGTLFET